MRRDPLAPRQLRFIRSCSAALAPQVLHDVEAAFGAPVLEAYGMTEAAHQMASNPLPAHGPHLPGSVGVGTDVQITIADDKGHHLKPNERGEVCIKGPNVTAGYESNPEANASAFFDGWFRTGDQGFLDENGYLTLVGRLKELINRGGEKISPREIDEVLMTHPAVNEAVCFGVPHRMWGEEVEAVVTLKEQVSEDAAAGVLQGEVVGLQAPETDSHHRRDSAHRDRQAPAARRRAGVRAEGVVPRMKIVIAGAGAIGGYIGARLARQGADVVLFARGPHLKAMQERGLRVISAEEGDFEVKPVRHRRPRDDRHLRRGVPWRQGARADRSGAVTQAAVRSGHGRRQHAERHSVVVFPEPVRASSTTCDSSGSIQAASSPTRLSRGACWARSPTSPPTSSSPVSSATSRATVSASASPMDRNPIAPRRSPKP